MKDQAYYISLFYKNLQGVITEEEKEIFDAYTSMSNGNKTFFEDLEKVVKVTDRYIPAVNVNIEHAFEATMTAVKNPIKSKTQQKFGWKKYVVAASFLLLVGFSAFWNYQSGKTDIAWDRYSYQEEGENVYHLEDGSVVYLNTGSSISFGFKENERIVQLDGEAFFEVAKDKKKPFSVTSANVQVRVLGTEFTVRDYGDEIKALVFVKEGKVECKSKGSSGRYILKKMDRLTYNKESKQVEYEKREDLNDLAWQSNELAFTSTPLPIVFEVLEKHLDVDIEGDFSQLKSCRFTMSNQKLNLTKLFDKLSKVYNINVRQTKNNSFFISGGSC